MTYGCETWSHRNTQLEKQVTIQRKMERIMVRNHPQRQKEWERDLETEWCDRHLSEIYEKRQTHMNGDTWRREVTTDGQSESQNGYPVDIKDL